MKNWKTTLIGCLIAIVIAIKPLIETGTIDYKQCGIAAVIALFGFLSKDANVTGGTVAQTTEAQKRVS